MPLNVRQIPMSPNPSLLDVHEIREVADLVATSSSPDSGSSVSTGSPTLLGPEHDIRSALPAVKFAPLPQIDYNRKRSLAPVGVSARSRRRRIIQQEGGPLLWSTDSDVPGENMEDPIITFAKFVKRTGQTFWRRMRKGSKAIPQENASYSAEPILDIGSTVHSGDVPPGEQVQGTLEVVGREIKPERPASWPPSSECRTLSRCLKTKRRSTSDLSVP